MWFISGTQKTVILLYARSAPLTEAGAVFLDICLYGAGWKTGRNLHDQLHVHETAVKPLSQ